jgi:peptidoglycan/LPS O-acetylase OafA/YrhL
MNKRFEELDALRGLAAISVVLLHFLLTASLVLPISDLFSKLNHTPIRFIWSGSEAVILFFILSGFVLSLPYYNNKVPKYIAYVVKRICRIYIPYLVSVSFAIILMSILYDKNALTIGGWFDISEKPIQIGLLISHVLLLGEFDSHKLNIVFWSLVHEMRISLIFPAIMFVVMKYKWKRNILIVALFSISFFLIYFISLKVFQYDVTKNSASYFSTLRYIPFFIIGALIAKYREFFYSFYKRMPAIIKLSLFVTAILTYTYPWWFLNNFNLVHMSFINDLMVAIGCLIFIVICIYSKTVKSILLLKPVQFIGKISYSLYLFHMIVLLSMVNGLYGKVPIVYILFGSFVISFIVASIMYYLVEIPSMRLGRNLTSRSSRYAGNSQIEKKVIENSF